MQELDNSKNTFWKRKLYVIIFEADTKLGRAFDLTLLTLISLSVIVVMFDSVEKFHRLYHKEFMILEWFFTIVFTVEYALRIYCTRYRWSYIFSFYGLVDLLAILPTYIAVIFPGLQTLVDVRIMRLLRVFRVMKLTAYVGEYRVLLQALRQSRRKIFVFLATIFALVVILGTIMYVIEGPKNGFSSIPTAIYWAITTVTTVGFGDLAPKTDLGRFISAFIMLLGWGVLAVPTGIVTAELGSLQNPSTVTTRTCEQCMSEGHMPHAHYCQYCGALLPEWKQHL